MLKTNPRAEGHSASQLISSLNNADVLIIKQMDSEQQAFFYFSRESFG